MRHHLSRSVLLAALVALCPGPAAARAEGRGGGARLVPAHVIHGVMGGEFVGVDFARGYAGAPTPDCLRLARRGEILQVGPNGATMTCTVMPGTPVFVFGFGSACSDIDPQDSGLLRNRRGRTAPVRARAHARRRPRGQRHRRRSSARRYRQRSLRGHRTQVTAVVGSDDNPFGVPAGTTAHLVGDIYAAAIRGLPPGRLTILVDAETAFGEATGTTIVNVVPSA